MIKTSTSTTSKLNTAALIVAAFSLFVLCMSNGSAHAQVLYNEGFEIGTVPGPAGPYPQIDLPLGWSQGKFGVGVDPDNEWEIMGNGTGPTCSPHGGVQQVRYNSEFINTGEAAYLSTKKLDMSGLPGGGTTGSFWMYRSSSGAAANDFIQVYASTVSDMTGSPTLLTCTVVGNTSTSVRQYCGAAPVSTCNAWVQVFFTVPYNVNFVTTSFYISILGTSADGQNVFIDDFSITTYPQAQTLVGTGTVVNQNTATTQPGLLDQQIIGLKLTVNGAGTPLFIYDMTWNTNGSDNPSTDIVNAKLWFTGGTQTLNTSTATLLGTVGSPQIWATNYTFLPGIAGSFSGLDNGDNYFWITYDINASATTGNYVDAECVSFWRVGFGAAITPVPQTINGRRLIDVVYCIPTYTVGTSWLNGSYTNNDYVRNVVLTGDVAPGINNTWNTNGPGLPFCNPCHFSAHPPDYEYFPPAPGKTAILTQGNNYPMQVQCGTWYSSNYIAAFIDYNRDGDFFDAGEKILQSTSMTSLSTYNANFTVPLTSIPGNTRLRVREVYATSNIQPCDHRTYGESEDYVVTIVPTCAPAWPGWKTWLGFTNDWDNPANWCGGVPTPSDNARIPQPGAGPNDRPGNYAPVIKAGVIATAKNLRIETNDSLFIDAPASSSLTLDSTLLILDNTAALIVNSSFSDSARVLNGTLTWPGVGATLQPLKGNVKKVKNVWIYTQDELLTQGLLPGDIITNMLFHVTRNSSNGAPFKNVTVTMYYTDAVNPIPTGFRFNLPGRMPPVIGSKTVVFGPADVNTATFIPVVGTDGTINITMNPGAFVWDGSANKLVVELCYDNVGYGVPNNNDLPKFTQTLGYQHYISIYGTKECDSYAACDMYPSSTISSAFFTGATAGASSFTMTGGYEAQVAPNGGQWLAGPGFSVTGAGASITSGSNVITYASTPPTIAVGMYMSGSGFLCGAKVTAKTATTVTVDQTSTLTLASATLTYYNYVTSVVGTTVNLGVPLYANAAGTIQFGGPNSAPSTGSDYRPNVTFLFDRPYEKYPITVRRDWLNNGTFVPAYSQVTMFTSPWGSGAAIGGTNPTTYFQLRINDPAHIRLDQDITVTDTLTLQNGRLKLNNHLVTLTMNDIGALYRINGFLQSDADLLGSDVAPFGRLRWDMGNITGNRIIPFVNTGGVSVFLDYNAISGTHDVTFATYGTPDNNTNIPLPIVTNILGQAAPGSYNTSGDGMADRYYMIDNQGSTPVADMTFRYASSEDWQYNLGAGTPRAQRWLNASSLWEFPYILNQNTPGSGSRLVNVTSFNQWSQNVWWTIVGESTPLPVELLDFTATPVKDKVRLDWTTASEFNSSHFVVERSLDNTDFSFIGQVPSRGPSTNTLKYQTWDLNPVEGIQYYYLRQYDIDGRFESFGPVSAKFSKNLFEIITASVSPSSNGVTVVFNYDSKEPFSYRIIDMTGRLIVAKDRNPGEPGVNVIDIETSLAHGAYQIILQNSDKVVAKKFFY